MKKAVIDLGTNTFNLLIAEIEEGKIVDISTRKEPVLLGMNGINEGRLSDNAMTRALETLGRFKAICANNGIDARDIHAIGTSAIRSAANRMNFSEQIKSQLGLELEIIDGNREAELIFQGVLWLYDFWEPAVVMDIGGGSTEFIWGSDAKIDSSHSLDIGVTRIFQTQNEPESFDETCREEIWQLLDGIHAFQNEPKYQTLIGASGSFETFWEMINKSPFPKEHSLISLDRDDLEECMNWVVNSSKEERNNHPWIIPFRKRMLPIAAMKIQWLMKNMNTDKVFISPYSLKEGVLRK